MKIDKIKIRATSLIHTVRNSLPSRAVVTAGIVCVVILALAAGFVVYDKGRTSQSQKPSSISLNGVIRPALATCDRHGTLIQIVQSGKQLYVVEADKKSNVQLELPVVSGRPVRVSGTVKGSQTVCVYGKSQTVVILNV